MLLLVQLEPFKSFLKAVTTRQTVKLKDKVEVLEQADLLVCQRTLFSRLSLLVKLSELRAPAIQLRFRLVSGFRYSAVTYQGIVNDENDVRGTAKRTRRCRHILSCWAYHV